MRMPTIYLASLVIVTTAATTAAAKAITPLARPTIARRSTSPRQHAVSPIVLVAPSRSAERVGKQVPPQLAIKAKREFLKAAVSFERYRIAQRKYPLKVHDQFEILPAQPAGATLASGTSQEKA